MPPPPWDRKPGFASGIGRLASPASGPITLTSGHAVRSNWRLWGTAMDVRLSDQRWGGEGGGGGGGCGLWVGPDSGAYREERGTEINSH